MLNHTYQAATLNTQFTAPLYFLERRFLERQKQIEAWFDRQWQLTSPPVYGSVDLRNAGFKLAPIDMNLFPAGFNNLNRKFLSCSVQAAQAIIQRILPGAQKIVVIPENHTRNLYYWSNIKTLQAILEQAGFAVRFGSFDPDLISPIRIELDDGESVQVEPLQRVGDRLQVTDFLPDLLLLNNDLSEGIPPILQQLDQRLIPPAELGWSQRLKSGHFQYYADVVQAFSAEIEIDPWLIAPLFRQCGSIDFMQQEGMDCLVTHAETLFAEIKQKYADYQIEQQPFLVVKADAGTYGMAVMTVRDVNELKSLNRKQRTRMATTKGGQPVNRVIIQEGVYTVETVGEEKSVAEPVLYLWGDAVVGGFYRVNKERGIDENLNAPGMRFEQLAFAEVCHSPSLEQDPDACCNRFFVYGVVARLSMLAAAREIKDQQSK